MKKAGIVVAGTALGLLAVSPLAFAGEGHHGHGGRDDSSTQVNSVDRNSGGDQAGLVNVGDVNALNDLNVCPGVAAGTGVGNVLGVLGGGHGAAGNDLSCENDNSVSQQNNN